jgi:predicted HAD superfamily hydrolase
MVDIQEYAKKQMPMYMSDQYRENRESGQWYKNVLRGEG